MPFFIESLPFLPLGWAGRVQRAAAAAGGALDQAVTSFRRLQPVRPYTVLLDSHHFSNSKDTVVVVVVGITFAGYGFNV